MVYYAESGKEYRVKMRNFSKKLTDCELLRTGNRLNMCEEVKMHALPYSLYCCSLLQ